MFRHMHSVQVDSVAILLLFELAHIRASYLYSNRFALYLACIGRFTSKRVFVLIDGNSRYTNIRIPERISFIESFQSTAFNVRAVDTF